MRSERNAARAARNQLTPQQKRERKIAEEVRLFEQMRQKAWVLSGNAAAEARQKEREKQRRLREAADSLAESISGSGAGGGRRARAAAAGGSGGGMGGGVGGEVEEEEEGSGGEELEEEERAARERLLVLNIGQGALFSMFLEKLEVADKARVVSRRRARRQKASHGHAGKDKRAGHHMLRSPGEQASPGGAQGTQRRLDLRRGVATIFTRQLGRVSLPQKIYKHTRRPGYVNVDRRTFEYEGRGKA